jgi:hypothetical protein
MVPSLGSSRFQQLPTPEYPYFLLFPFAPFASFASLRWV